MRYFWWLSRHEIRVLLVSPATYIALILTVSLMGLLYLFTLLQTVNGNLDRSPTEAFFSTFWLPALLLVPMLTMRSLAEERRLGTLSVLLVSRIDALSVVLAKYLAAFLVYLLTWLLALAFPLLASWQLDQPGVTAALLNEAELTGAYLFLLLTGSLFVAVGVFSSALTRSQLVAGMLCFMIMFILVIGTWIGASSGIFQGLESILGPDGLRYLQVFDHFEALLLGILDSRPVVYYLSGTGLVLGLASLVVKVKS